MKNRYLNFNFGRFYGTVTNDVCHTIKVIRALLYFHVVPMNVPTAMSKKSISTVTTETASKIKLCLSTRYKSPYFALDNFPYSQL